jgi:putative hemolysin
LFLLTILGGWIFAAPAILGLLFVNVLITGAEKALFTLTPRELEELEKKWHPAFKRTQNLIARPRHLLMLVQIINTSINVAIVFLLLKGILNNLSSSLISIITYAVILSVAIGVLLAVEEIIPNYFSGKNNVLWARWMATPMWLLGNLFYPITEIIINTSSMIERNINRNRSSEEALMEKPEEQLAEAVNDAVDEPILKAILKFNSIVVRQVMRSRIDMACLDEKLSFEQLLSFVRDARYSRLPVYRDHIDNIIGVFYTKDLIALLPQGNSGEWQRLIREVYFCPEGKKIAALMLELQQKQLHIAVVIDEYGRTAGLITLEDIVEEIIGEIRDETDERIELEFTRIDDHNFLFEGKTSIADFCRVLNLPEDYFSEVQGDADSLGGLLLEISGSIPEPQEVIQYKELSFLVLSLEKYRIKRVKVTLEKQPVEA